MQSFEIFTTEEKAKEFITKLIWEGAEPEIEYTEEYGENDEVLGMVYVVYYYPPKMQ